MNPTERLLLHLLDCTLNEKPVDVQLTDGVDWEALFRLAQEHTVDAMLLDAICTLPEASQPAEMVLAAWQENAMLTMMGQSLLVSQLHLLLESLAAADIQTIVLKGVVLKALYPQPDLRTMNDADLLVSGENINRARQVLEQDSFTLEDEEPGVFAYRGPGGLRVELHEQLFDKTAYGFLSRLDEADMFPISSARVEPVYGGDAWVFPPMEHALFMLAHMAKHMITTGFGVRQVMDFIVYARFHDETMDWPAFWQRAKTLGLDMFASAILTCGTLYFSLPKGKWAEGQSLDTDAADGLLLDLLDAGVFGHRTEERRRSAAVVYRSYDEKDGNSGRVRRALFPSANTLKSPYLYARNHPVLLPIAWVHRLINYLIGVLTGRIRHADTTASLDVADARLMLLDTLGLRDDASTTANKKEKTSDA